MQLAQLAAVWYPRSAGRSPRFVAWYTHGTFTRATASRSNAFRFVIFDDLPKFYELATERSRKVMGIFFWSLDGCGIKSRVLCLKGSCHSTESQLGRPKLPKVCLSDFHLSALSSELRVVACFLVLKTHVSTTWKTLLPIVAPMPAIKFKPKPILFGVPEVRLYIYIIHSGYNYIPHWRPAISCGLGHHLHIFAPTRCKRCTNFQRLTHQLFHHQEFKIIVWQPRSTSYVRVRRLHMTSSK